MLCEMDEYNSFLNRCYLQCAQFIQHAAKSPNIRFIGVWFILADLGANIIMSFFQRIGQCIPHIVRSTDRSQRLCLSILQNFRNTEISEFYCAV